PVHRDGQGYVRGYASYLSFDETLFFRLLTSRRADVYLVEPPPTTAAVVRVAAWLLGRPFVYDVADLWADAARATTDSRLVLGALAWIESFALRGTAHAVTISDGVVGRVRELGLRTPMTVVGFGVDSSQFTYTSADRADRPHLVYAGRYSEWQGAVVFVDAFAMLKKHHPAARLTFVGNGTERELLEARVAELELKDVHFASTVPPSELAPILGQATVALASLSPQAGYDYAFCSKVYAPLAVGCPVIFAGVGPTAPFIKGANEYVIAGLAVDHDVGAVLGAMRRLIERPPTEDDRRRLSEWTRTHHSVDRVAGRIAKVIEHMRGGR
ncbi:MAG: glycosyltransferase family 4 protein, partial [Cryobacterium sp.]|nr:glycosyltransferase family 4 protein [Cryobacterium sp.]